MHVNLFILTFGFEIILESIETSRNFHQLCNDIQFQ